MDVPGMRDDGEGDGDYNDVGGDDDESGDGDDDDEGGDGYAEAFDGAAARR